MYVYIHLTITLTRSLTLSDVVRCLIADTTESRYVYIHNIADDHTDPILNALRRCQMFNSRYDRVKVCIYSQHS